MLRYLTLLLAITVPNASTHIPPAAAPQQQDAYERVLGRWDITITTPEGPRPSWLEVERSGRDAVIGRFVGIVGSARPISSIATNGDSLSFTIPHQWEDGDGQLTVRGRVQAGGLAAR